ncbi:MAG: pantoate--beta-alanine ligase [Candidatus Omnitrophica bacterium]|nr:pantoate--beta-alanine ligase [Candidatus Omnitrophota bacterium]MBU4477977.1 pantoate--beta-alanine ligase [Candidatus Omnitrophota bacterium]MCG2703387.1 pantoate--beta-alanine ligase [Candidatus Omnitrophota bacterium]
MKLVYSIAQMQRISRALRKAGKIIGFVPTMGYLHEGHLSLVRRCRKDCDMIVMSIYVNPLQFGPQEDYRRYPRDLKRDAALAGKEKVDYLFVPRDADMYPGNYNTIVEVKGISDSMCGALRPGHFKGVATVVTKLFNIVLPDVAYFGQKDAQQAAVIKSMVRDLNMAVRINVLPIRREPDGLAMSSRNAYLNASQRRDARILYEALRKARRSIEKGERSARRISEEMKKLICKVNSAIIEYIVIVDARDFKEKKTIEGRVLLALAVWIGKVRLIDNMEV